MRILFLSRWFPYPINNGSKIRIFNLIKGLSAQHQVTLLCFTDETNSSLEAPELESLCEHIETIEWKPFNPNSLKSKLGFFSLRPRSFIDVFSSEMAQRIGELVNTNSFDLVIASQWDMAQYSPYFQNTPAIFEELELGLYAEKSLHTSSTKDQIRSKLTWMKYRFYLLELLKNFQSCTVTSEKEKTIFKKINSDFKNIQVVPNCIDLDSYYSELAPKQNSLIFTGPFRYYVNYEAMLWFVKDAFQQIRQQIPEVELTITGDHANLPLPSTENINLVGFVDDIQAEISQSWLSIAPLQEGGGTRLKILESMALRTPVVATSKGAEGLDVQSGIHLLIADTPQEFAQACTILLKDKNLRQELAANAFKLVSEKYDWAVAMPSFLQLIEEAVQA